MKSQDTNYPDTEAARHSVEMYEELNGKLNKKNREILYLISSYSRFLGRYAINDPGLINDLEGKGFVKSEKTLGSYKKEIKKLLFKTVDEDELARKLRIYKYREFARIVYKDIVEPSNFPAVLSELSGLSEAVIDSVYQYYAKQFSIDKYGSFFVLAMGKLGGQLLNLSSDVDLIYIFKEKNGSDVFFKLAEKITKTLSLVTDNGFLYRVDLGLRPGGSKSTIAVQYDGAIDHYYYWGDTWERASLIQSRPVAGDIALGRKFIQDIDQFVYKKSLDYESIEDLKDMKLKLDQLKKENDVKLGKGGIREIEFFVQANQLVNSGQFNELKGLNTMDCLHVLSKREILSDETRTTLEKSYLFLRRVEHNIQLVDEIQTHKIPSDGDQLLKLAKRTGFKTIRSFRKQLTWCNDGVSAEYNQLFFEPSKKIEEYANEFWHLADFLTEGNVGEQEAIEALIKLGFKNPDTALDLISSLIDTRRGGLTQKGRMIARRVIPAFLSSVLKSYDHDTALVNLEKFITAIGWKTSIYAVLIENPDMLNLLTKFFSTSGVLSTFLIRHPEYLDILTLKSSRKEYRSVEEMTDELKTLVDSEKDFEGKLDSLRHFKHVETLKLCLRDLNREVGSVYVGKYLSMIASAVLNISLELAIKETKRHFKTKANLKKILILGMGKFAGGEMSYNSDLDLIFIYEGDDHEAFSRLGQRLISILSVPTSEGICYKIDLDLRPSGRSGALVTSYESFKKYHHDSAQLWERQALIRAVPCAGDAKLSEKVMKTITEFVYLKPLEKEFHKEIGKIRYRMENELAKETVNKVNVKTGRGGLVDIEFIVQMLQLRYGKKYKSIRLANTLDAINAMELRKLLSQGDAETLKEGYLFLKRIENILRLLKDKSISDITDEDFNRLSVESIKYNSGEELKSKYLKTTKKIRKIYEGYF